MLGEKRLATKNKT